MAASRAIGGRRPAKPSWWQIRRLFGSLSSARRFLGYLAHFGFSPLTGRNGGELHRCCVHRPGNLAALHFAVITKVCVVMARRTRPPAKTECSDLQ